MNVIGLIPARLESTRLPRKLLLRETGKPLIQHVYERVQQAQELSDVFVATDSEEIAKVIRDFGGKVVKTGPAASGTDRLAQACQTSECANFEGIINVQGDEPEIAVSTINALAKTLKAGLDSMVTVAVWEANQERIKEPSIVKLVLNSQGYALYFSRSLIPYFREASETGFYRHLGIYGYTRDFLLKYTRWEPTPLEQAEKLEQLRVLENGFRIKVLLVQDDHIGIDVQEDYDRFVKRFKMLASGVLAPETLAPEALTHKEGK